MTTANATWDEMKAATDAAFAEPKAGDLFHEMYSYWVAVLHAQGNVVTYVTKAGGLRGDGEYTLHASSADEFRNRFSYGAPDLGHWVILSRRDADVTVFASSVAS